MNEENSSRRTVLRGALALGCGLCLPLAIFGCDSKPGSTSTSAAPAVPASSPPVTNADSAAPAPARKMSQANVRYQGGPKGEQKCAGCEHFVAGSNVCKLVEGQISAEGWCVIWVKKT